MSEIPKNQLSFEHGDVAFFQYILRKIQKITGALYLVSDFFPVDEPLRGSIRQNALNLLYRTYALREQDEAVSPKVFISLSGKLEELLSLLEIARAIGLVSDANFSILKSEVEGLISILNPEGQISAPSLKPGQFELPRELEARARVSASSAWDNGEIKNIEKNPKTRAQIGSTLRGKRVSVSAQKRQDVIVELARSQGGITMRQIARALPDCSRKTLQRDLNILIDEEGLKKKGNRRWSTYFLGEGKGENPALEV